MTPPWWEMFSNQNEGGGGEKTNKAKPTPCCTQLGCAQITPRRAALGAVEIFGQGDPTPSTLAVLSAYKLSHCFTYPYGPHIEGED